MALYLARNMTGSALPSERHSSVLRIVVSAAKLVVGAQEANREDEGFVIKDGIVVVTKGAVLTAGTVI